MIPAAAAAALAARRGRGGNRVWAVAAGVGVGALVMVALSGGGSTDVLTAPSAVTAAAPAAAAGGVCADTGRITGLDDAQSGIARRAVAAADRHQVGDRGAQIITAAGIVESDLRNLDYGDRDSLGLFQQRPSQGWGTREQIMNPTYSAAAFFRALGRVDGWRRMDPGAAAQAVQRSAFPARYAQRMDEAARIVAALGGGSTGCTNVASTDTNVAVNVRPVIAWAITQMGKPYVFGANGPNAWDCSSFSQRAFRQIGITMPRTAQAQRDWCASGKCGRIPLGKERPGDLIFWNSYLGPTQIGHVMIVKNADTKMTLEAHRTCRAGDTQGKTCGTGSWSYSGITKKSIGEIWRVRQ